VVVRLPEGNLLVDTPPELRLQLLRVGIGRVHAVLYTHEHADHLFGLDDLRIFPEYLGKHLPVFCTAAVEARIRRVFDYAFDPITANFPAGGVPRLEFHRVSDEPFTVLGATVVPIPLLHGPYEVLGYRFGGLAYCTDTNGIPPQSRPHLRDLEVLILDCLRRRPHPTHFSLAEAMATARELGARQTYFTHISHDLEHASTSAQLPPGMALAHDGLRLGWDRWG
jgi:phosphoribosyl 1,2-cyclic phosphate phosphodiesterase